MMAAKPLTRKGKLEVLNSSEALDSLDAYSRHQFQSLIKVKASTTGDSGSRDLFSSPVSSRSATSRNRRLEVTSQLNSYGWVQCEYPDCQKWRRIPATEANNLGDDPWYCNMNSDPNAQHCSAPEEDYTFFDKLARKAGVKFVMSLLQVGTLVWAKTAGYCKWPAIVSRDPITGVHLHMDIDGDPHSYHVEYLGNPHTHSWVKAGNVELYGHKDTSKFAEPKYNPKRRGRGRKLLLNSVGSKNRQCYRRVRVEEVRKEADYLLTMAADERSRFCVFKYHPDAAAACMADARETSEILTPVEERGVCMNCGENSSRKKPVKVNSKSHMLHRQQNSSSKKLSQKQTNAGSKNRSIKWHPYKDRRNISPVKSEYQELQDEDLPSYQVPQHSDPEMLVSQESPARFTQACLNVSTSMINRTKEEKFKIDIEMYRRNEKAFEHDVRRFLARNQLKIRPRPVWNSVPVSIFQLFLAVHERGGYRKACAKKCWASVYRELSQLQHASSGHVAKAYYKRNLYPYELFISGEDYESLLQERKWTKKPGPKSTSATDKEMVVPEVSVPVVMETALIDRCDKTLPALQQCQEETGSDVDLDALLGELEQDYHTMYQFENQVDASKKKLGIDITFYDESPSEILSPDVKHASMATEFGNAYLPEEAATEEVPFADTFYEQDDEMLYEMQALEDQVQAFHQEMQQHLL